MEVQTLAREYLRVSADRSGRQRSVEEQHTDNEQAAKTAGLTLAEPYREANGISASRYSRKTRDAFARLLADLESDTFGAGVLMLWESSRGSRRAGEWVTLLELLEERGVRVHVTTHGRTYDPAVARDRRSLLEDAIDSEYESSKVSARVTRAAAASAAAGRPHGVPPFGYQRVFDERTGRLINWEPHPDEAPVMVELFDRLRRGHSFRAIARDFEARGIVNRSGTPFAPAHLRSNAVKVAYCGQRTHRGEVLDGTWPALVSVADFLAVQRIITNPARKTTRHGRAVHELTMIIRCDVCGGPLIVTVRSDGKKPGAGLPRYQCRDKGCIRIEKSGVDDIVIGAMLAYLASDKVYDMLAETGDDDRMQQVRDDLAKARAELDELHDLAGSGQASVRFVARAEPQIVERITRLEAEERTLSTPPALQGFIEPGKDVAERWEAAPISARREVAHILLSPAMLGEVRIMPSPRRGHWVDPIERIRWVRS